MKKIIPVLLIFCMLFTVTAHADGEKDREMTVEARSAVLMEAKTGTVLFSQNADTAYAPASVTKVMTLLLVAEALERGCFGLSDTVSVSEYAASMGGSQVFMQAGERMSVEELIKCTVIASANDCAVALAELVSGSEESFVGEMNKRAGELGMTHSHFENVTGLDDTVTDHVMSAGDIAVASRELLRHGIILKYSSLWQDSIRDGAFTLTNTNRLVRFYEGCNGLKTGSTDKAGFCVSATAKRGNMQLIAVVMGSADRDARNRAARSLLDYGFAKYALYEDPSASVAEIPVTGGTTEKVGVVNQPFCAVIEKGKAKSVRRELSCPDVLYAPVKKNDPIGTVTYLCGEQTVGEGKLLAEADVEKITYGQILCRMLRGALLGWGV